MKSERFTVKLKKKIEVYYWNNYEFYYESWIIMEIIIDFIIFWIMMGYYWKNYGFFIETDLLLFFFS